MKFTFRHVLTTARTDCDDCNASLCEAASYWLNWRDTAQVRFLCEACHRRRAIRVGRHVKAVDPVPELVDPPLWRIGSKAVQT